MAAMTSTQVGKSEASTSTAPLPVSFKIVAGSYEKLLYGLEVAITGSTSSGLSFRLDPVFIFPAHVACIKAVAASPSGGKWLATGSTDEVIKVWDLRRRKEVGGLMHHEGSITYLHFPSRSHLLSASEDGTLCLFRARDWVVLRVLKGHKGRVNCVAVHPSGKVALSVGKDRALRMWDLMRGKGSASTKIGKEGEIVRWSSDGSMFAVQSQATIDLYTTNMNLLHSITHPARIHDIKFVKLSHTDNEVLLVAAEDKQITVYAVSNGPNSPPVIIAKMIGHSNRVRAVDTISIDIPSSMSSNSKRRSATIACTASSDGKIHVYDMGSIPSTSSSDSTIIELTPVGQYDSKGTRLTCMTIADIVEVPHDSITGKRKRVIDDDTKGGIIQRKNIRLSEGGQGGELQDEPQEQPEDEEEADEDEDVEGDDGSEEGSISSENAS